MQVRVVSGSEGPQVVVQKGGRVTVESTAPPAQHPIRVTPPATPWEPIAITAVATIVAALSAQYFAHRLTRRRDRKARRATALDGVIAAGWAAAFDTASGIKLIDFPLTARFEGTSAEAFDYVSRGTQLLGKAQHDFRAAASTYARLDADSDLSRDILDAGRHLSSFAVDLSGDDDADLSPDHTAAMAERRKQFISQLRAIESRARG